MKKTRIAITGASLFVTLICWALSSPINSHGDEKYYIGSIWCADGYNEQCVPLGIDNYGNRVALFRSEMCVPPGIEDTYKRLLIDRTVQGCQYEINGNGQWEEFTVSPNSDYATDRYVATNINTTLSPQYFFRFMNNFVSENLASSVVLMRIVTAAIFCLLLTLLLAVGSLLVNQGVLTSLYLTMIPHGLFLSSGITVSGWAYIGCSFSWAFLYVVLDSGPKMNLRTVGAVVGWIASGMVVVASRYDAIIYLIFSNFVIVALKFIGRKPNFVKIGLVLIPFAGSFIYLRSESQVIKSLTSASLGNITSALDLILVLGNSVKLAIATPLRIAGIERLGWVDLGPPSHTYIANIILVFAISSIIFRCRTRLQAITFTTISIFYFLICLSQTHIHPDWSTPFYYVRTSWRNDNFASRYFIPIFPFIIGLSIILAKDFGRYIRRKNFGVMIVSILSFTNFSTLDGVNKIFRENPTWYWLNFPLGINSIFIVGVTSFFIFLLTTTLIITDAPKSRNMTSWLRIKNGGRIET
jgi:hypothetical protein